MAAEARLQSRTIALAKRMGMLPVRLAFRQGVTAGWPDALLLAPNGLTLWMEFKSLGKRPTPIQLHRIRQLERLGHIVCVADNFDTARSAIASALERASLSAPRSRAPESQSRRRAVA